LLSISQHKDRKDEGISPLPFRKEAKDEGAGKMK
jgi:hypothetical protein